MINLFGIAYFLNRINNSVGVLLKGVVDTGLRAGKINIIVNSQPSSNIQVFQRYPPFLELHINLCNFLYGTLECLDIRNLASHVEMQQLETADIVLFLEFIHQVEQFRD